MLSNGEYTSIWLTTDAAYSQKTWSAEGHRVAIWAPESVSIIKHVKLHLDQQLRPFLNRRCAQIRSHGGVKGSIRCSHALSSCCRFVARFDIRSYYESINHKILIDLLGSAGVSQSFCNIVSDYLRLPDVNSDGSGMLAGGAISPLLGAVFTSLDRAMARLERCRRDLCWKRLTQLRAA